MKSKIYQVLAIFFTIIVYYLLFSPSPALAEEKLFYIHQDHLGSTALVTDEEGNIVSRQTYYPYGATRSLHSPDSNFQVTERQYTGQVSDQDQTGLYYYNARYYNPQIAKFTQADEIEGPNRYTYVANNPIISNDPSGHMEDGGGSALPDYFKRAHVLTVNELVDMGKKQLSYNPKYDIIDSNTILNRLDKLKDNNNLYLATDDGYIDVKHFAKGAYYTYQKMSGSPNNSLKWLAKSDVGNEAILFLGLAASYNYEEWQLEQGWDLSYFSAEDVPSNMKGFEFGLELSKKSVADMTPDEFISEIISFLGARDVNENDIPISYYKYWKSYDATGAPMKFADLINYQGQPNKNVVFFNIFLENANNAFGSGETNPLKSFVYNGINFLYRNTSPTFTNE